MVKYTHALRFFLIKYTQNNVNENLPILEMMIIYEKFANLLFRGSEK